MNVEYLNTFVEVVKLGNFSKTAKKLYLSQPAVTLQIQRLEKELGFRLIERNTHHLLLTLKGKRLFRFAEYVCQEHKHLLYDIAQIDRGITGRISAVASPVIGEFIVPSLMSRFKESNPTIEINVKIADSVDIIKEVTENPGTVGFSSVMAESPDLKYFGIGEDQTVLIVYPGHPLAMKEKVTIADLVGESLIFRDETVRGQAFYPKILKKAGLDLDNYQPKIVMGTISGVLSAVESKAGIGFVSKLAIKNSEAMGMIKVVKIENLNPRSLRHTFYFLHNKNMIPDALLENFIYFIKENKLTNQDRSI